MQRSCAAFFGLAASSCSERRFGLRGVPNDIDENVLLGTFSAWRIEQMQRAEIPSDTRTLEVLLARMTR